MANYPGGGGAPRPRRDTAGPDQQDRRARREENPRFQRQQRKNYHEILAGMSVKARQKWLQRMGYNVAVDGILGPQTKAATKAFLTKVPASRWNHGSQTKASGPSHPSRIQATKPGAGGGGRGGGGGGGGGGSPALPKLGEMPALLGGEDPLINPAAYAKSSVAMEFDPTIGGLTRDIRQQRAQGSQNIADIRSWFSQLEGTRAAGASANEAAGTAAIGDLERMQAAARASFGGDQGDAASYSGIGLAGLKGIAASQGNFDRNMAAILGSQGNEASIGEQRRQSDIMQGLTSKRSDLFQQKGSAYSKALQDAILLRTQQRGQNIQQQSALESLKLARSMAPYELANAQTGLQNDRLNMRLKSQQARQQTAGFKQNQRESALDYQVKKAQYDDFVAQLGDEGKQGFSDLTPKDRLGLSESLRSMAAGSNGNVAAMRTINGALNAAGFSTKNPAVRTFANSILVSLPGYRPNRGKKKKK